MGWRHTSLYTVSEAGRWQRSCYGLASYFSLHCKWGWQMATLMLWVSHTSNYTVSEAGRWRRSCYGLASYFSLHCKWGWQMATLMLWVSHADPNYSTKSQRYYRLICMICKGNNSTVTHLMCIVQQWSVLYPIIVDISSIYLRVTACEQKQQTNFDKCRAIEIQYWSV